jgi:sugar-specific transcriptional regulator TrmB
MDHRLSVLSTALDELEPAHRSEEQQGVWTVNGQPAVTDRVIEFVQGADDEIVYMTVEDLLTDDVIDALGTAAERGVTISLGGVSSDVQDRIKEDIPGAELFDSLWVWSDTPAGHLHVATRGDRPTCLRV